MRQFRISHPTFLKSSTKQSSEHNSSELIPLSEDTILTTDEEIKEIDGHYEITLKKYIYKQHLEEINSKEILPSNKQNVSLVFTLPLTNIPSRELLYGNLTLTINEEKIVYKATSGAKGHQFLNNYWTTARSPIPPGNYTVNATPYYLGTKGIEGLFFPIKPDPIIGPNGQKRTQIGLHHDANVPGSAGCIVIINKQSFNTFCERIKSTKVTSIPLIVKYN